MDKIIEKLERVETRNNSEIEKEMDPINQEAVDIITRSERRKSSVNFLEGMESIQMDGEPVDSKWLKCHRILGAPIAFSSPRTRYNSSELCLFTSLSRERF